MNTSSILAASFQFLVWELSIFVAAIALARRFAWRNAAEYLLAVLAIEVTLESSVAALFSFAHINSSAAYWITAAVFAGAAFRWSGKHETPVSFHFGLSEAAIAALTVPLLFLASHPVEEIDSINYLHYLIDWMGNRATPYTFATNYVAFWELSFLPAWTVTKVDLFFPVLALKAVFLLALAAWLVGREFGLRGKLLMWTVFTAVTMRHFWVDFSGVPTLKNDALHGTGFALLTLVVIRLAKGRLHQTDYALLAFGSAFASVKYTGIFIAVFALLLVWIFQRGWRWLIPVTIFFLFTSGHYYFHNSLLYGSPFYPFQINLGPIHLPGTADLSGTSILYSLRDREIWKLFFTPKLGLSPAGLLFPLTLLSGLLLSAWQCARWAVHRKTSNVFQLAGLMILCGWLLYFRSVYSASGWPGDLIFVRNGLNSIRYVDGVLAITEVFLISWLSPFEAIAASLIAINLASRLLILYAKIPVATYSIQIIFLSAALALAFAWLDHAVSWRFRPRWIGFAVMICAVPFLVQHRSASWTAYWNDLKPALDAARSQGLVALAIPEGGYYASHPVAAGNPVNSSVRSIEMQELKAAPPRFVTILVMPGSAPDWAARYADRMVSLGYRETVKGTYGALLERDTLVR